MGVLLLTGWGPERETFTMDKPAPYITFNSISDNNNEVGNELYFVSAREYGTNDSWSDTTIVERGEKYSVRMYVHNNASKNLSLVADNVKAFINLPNNWAKKIQVDGIISSDNATPNAIWDQTTFTCDENFALTCVPGSIKYYNNSGVFSLPDTILTSKGASLGYEQMDGLIPGCVEYSGYVTLILEPMFFESQYEEVVIKTWVRKDGAENWSESVEAEEGDLLDFRTELKNTGNSTVWNLTAKWYIPSYMELEAGTTEIYNSTHPDGVIISDTIMNEGVNIGHYGSGSNVWLYFSVRIGETPPVGALADCIGFITNEKNASLMDTVVVSSKSKNKLNSEAGNSHYYQGITIINNAPITNTYSTAPTEEQSFFDEIIIGLILLLIGGVSAILFKPLKNKFLKKFPFFRDKN
jgi:hypothetical protein